MIVFFICLAYMDNESPCQFLHLYAADKDLRFQSQSSRICFLKMSARKKKEGARIFKKVKSKQQIRSELF